MLKIGAKSPSQKGSFLASGGLGSFWQHFPRSSLPRKMWPKTPGSPGLLGRTTQKIEINFFFFFYPEAGQKRIPIKMTERYDSTIHILMAEGQTPALLIRREKTAQSIVITDLTQKMIDRVMTSPDFLELLIEKRGAPCFSQKITKADGTTHWKVTPLDAINIERLTG